MDDLYEIKAIPFEIQGRTIWIRTDIEGNCTEMFRVAGVRIPQKELDKRN